MVSVKRLPKLVLAAAAGGRDRRQTQEYIPIFQIRLGRLLLLNAISYISHFSGDWPIAITPSPFAGPVRAVDRFWLAGCETRNTASSYARIWSLPRPGRCYPNDRTGNRWHSGPTKTGPTCIPIKIRS